MSDRLWSGDDGAEAVLEALFAHPPINRAELEQRLARADPALLRRALVERLCGGALGAGDRGLFTAAFAVLGVCAEGATLGAVVADRVRPLAARAAALTVLAEEDPAALAGLLRTLPTAEAAQLTDQWLTELLSAVQADPAVCVGVARTLEAASGPLRGCLLDHLERCRARSGTSAAAAYGEALHRAGLLDLRRRLLALIVAEADDEGIALLEALWREAADPTERRALQGALLRARTRRIDPDAVGEAPTGCAHVGSCDGQGVFVVVGCFQHLDGTVTVAELSAHVAGGVDDGFVVPQQSLPEAEQLLRELQQETGVAFVHVSLAAAATLVTEAAARTMRHGATLPPEARPAVALFGRAVTPDALPAAAEDSPDAAPDLAALRALLRRPEYEHTWFFDRGDLNSAGVELPGAAAIAAWSATAAAALAADAALCTRVVEMARYMARWHTWDGDAAAAALCQAAARATARSFADSPLVVTMLERSVVPTDESAVGERRVDPLMVRQHLKRLFFHHVCAPKARDLARLDFTEAALASLEEAFLALPGERRPREEQRTTAAFAVGTLFADFLLAGARPAIEPMIAQMVKGICDFCHLDREESQRVVASILPDLGEYLDHRCSSCPVACLDRPRADVAEAFFQPQHPAES